MQGKDSFLSFANPLSRAVGSDGGSVFYGVTSQKLLVAESESGPLKLSGRLGATLDDHG
jgi:hypothetical protein